MLFRCVNYLFHFYFWLLRKQFFMLPISKYCYKMNLYLLFIVFLYVGRCNTRVVPLDFKLDKSKLDDSSGIENELINESPLGKIDILGHNLPDINPSDDLALLNSEDKNATVVSTEISDINASNLSVDSTPNENDTDEESKRENSESLDIADLLLGEELDATAELISQNNSDSRNAFEIIQAHGTLNEEMDEDSPFNDETSITNNSSLDLEQGNNLDLVKIEEKMLNDTLHQSKTFENVNNGQNEAMASFEAVNSDQNETFSVLEVFNGTNSTDDFFKFQPLSNETKAEEVFVSDAKNITEKFETDNLISENLEDTNNSLKTKGGILSGFEFLINSEVARNAAKAMEVFNFSDPLTDHIMEENEFHSFLHEFNPVHDLDSPNQTDLKTTEIVTNSSGESNEVRGDFNSSLPSRDKTSIVAKPNETNKNSSMPFNLKEPLEEENKTQLEEKLDGNLISEASSPLENSEENIELASEATISKENNKESISNSSAVDVPECPPSGWCIFWFLSQDACAVNDHCHGRRICCKIGCSKTCIEVESS